MKLLAVIVLSLSAIAASAANPWTIERFEAFLRGDSRFIESDYDEDDEKIWHKGSAPVGFPWTNRHPVHQ